MKRLAAWTHVLIGLSLAVLLLFFAEQYRAGNSPNEPMLPVVFEHGDHTETACTNCHHDYLDNSGSGLCYTCHKQSPEIAADMQAMFHDFCFDCHVSKRQDDDAGPQRECSGCHN